MTRNELLTRYAAKSDFICYPATTGVTVREHWSELIPSKIRHLRDTPLWEDIMEDRIRRLHPGDRVDDGFGSGTVISTDLDTLQVYLKWDEHPHIESSLAVWYVLPVDGGFSISDRGLVTFRDHIGEWHVVSWWHMNRQRMQSMCRPGFVARVLDDRMRRLVIGASVREQPQDCDAYPRFGIVKDKRRLRREVVVLWDGSEFAEGVPVGRVLPCTQREFQIESSGC